MTFGPRRLPHGSLGLLLLHLSGAALASDFVTVGQPGNACDPQPQGCFGAVGYVFEIGTFEVTNEEWVDMLEDVAEEDDPHELWHPGMGDPWGHIQRSGASPS